MSEPAAFMGRAYVALEPAGDRLRVQCVHCGTQYDSGILDAAVTPEHTTWQCTSGQCFGRLARWREIVTPEEQLRRTIERTNKLLERLAPSQPRAANEQVTRLLLAVTKLWPQYEHNFARDSDLSGAAVTFIIEKLERAELWEREVGYPGAR